MKFHVIKIMILKEDHRFRALEKVVLRRIYEHRGQDVTWRWENCIIRSSENVIRIVKPPCMRCKGIIQCKQKRLEMHTTQRKETTWETQI
jgi:hypothetical protein